MNIVAIGAHPDDIEYGCCRTILKHIKCGDKVFFIVLSYGEKGGDETVRIKECENSAREIGAKLFLFDFPDTKIQQSHEIIEKIEEIIRKVRPNRIYTHSIKDIHQDHRNAAYNSLVAGRSIPEILFYESPSMYLDFNPNYYIDITNFINKKIEILNKYKTQNGKDFMKINAIQGLAQFRGFSSSVKYAEAFDAVRILKFNDSV